jgi:hypothetical protein
LVETADDTIIDDTIIDQTPIEDPKPVVKPDTVKKVETKED